MPISLGPVYVGGPGPLDELAYNGIEWSWFGGILYIQKLVTSKVGGYPAYFDELTLIKFVVIVFVSLIIAFVIDRLIFKIRTR